MEPTTFSKSIDDLKRDVGFEPKTELATGIANRAAWYRAYHRIWGISGRNHSICWATCWRRMARPNGREML